MHLIITQHWSTVQTTYKLYKPHDDVIQLINIPLNIPLEQLYHKQWTSPFPCGWDWLASLHGSLVSFGLILPILHESIVIVLG